MANEYEDMLETYPTYYTRNNLINDLSYRTTVNVDGFQLFILIEYNSKSKKRVLTITDINDHVVLPSTTLSAKRRIEPLFIVNEFGYDMYITLEPKDNNNISKDYLNWADHFYLTFVSTSIDFTDYWDEMTRKTFTS